MILVLVLLHFCNFVPVSTLYLENRFPEFLGAKNLSNINADRSQAGSELNPDHAQGAIVDPEDPVLIRTLPVGSGDATIIQCPSTTNKWFSLIDMGSIQWNIKNKQLTMTVLNYLATLNSLMGHTSYQLKHIFLTHPDKDHLNYGYEEMKNDVGETYYSGLLPLLINQEPKVTIHLSSWDNWNALRGKTGSFMDNFMRFLGENYANFNWKEYEPNGPNVIDICGSSELPSQVKMKIIAADLGKKTETNEMSMVMSLSYQGQPDSHGGKMLFLGDFQGVNQYNLLFLYEKYRKYLPADVVMVPHHGSDTNGNGNRLFYDLVNARHAIISSHIGSSYGHPRLTTLASICDGFYMIDEAPYYPYGLCNADGLFCNGDDMAQGHGDIFYLNNDHVNVNIKGGCRTKIHQTTKRDRMNQVYKAYIVETRLYPHKAPEVTSGVPWNTVPVPEP